ncbi:unnamed protein product, partial [Meganyctiphanes norvegica]
MATNGQDLNQAPGISSTGVDNDGYQLPYMDTGGNQDAIPDTEVVLPAQPVEGASEDEESGESYSLLSFLPKYRKKRKKGPSDNQSPMMGAVKTFAIPSVLLVLYLAYIIAVFVIESEIQKGDYWCEGDGLVIIITSIAAVGLIYFKIIKGIIWKRFGKNISIKLRPVTNIIKKIMDIKVMGTSAVGMSLAIAVFLVLGIVLIAESIKAGETQRLQSALGIVTLIAFGFLFSHAPRKVIWRHLMWGLGLQFGLGLFILRWETGRAIFDCISGKVTTFLAFTDEGSSFVYGDLVQQGIFAFSVLPVILWFSFVVGILYYFGIMQWVVMKIGWGLQMTIGTTVCESVNAAGNIFLGQVEAPLLVRPYLPKMTRSELHAIMTGGFATIAGSVMAAYIKMGVNPTTLISGSLMNAPSALAFSKLFYPETGKTKLTSEDVKGVKSEESGWLHAGMNGVTNALPLVANVGASLVAFLSFIAFFNHFFNWSCMLLGAEEGQCSLENVFGYIFLPLAWTFGVEWRECDCVGQLIGIKSMVNEFVAYPTMVDMVNQGIISPRAEMIATYCLCGFANVGSIGMTLGGLSAMAPERRNDMAKVVVRAVIAGSCASFMTACVSGLLLVDLGGDYSGIHLNNDTHPCINGIYSTNTTQFYTLRPIRFGDIR